MSHNADPSRLRNHRYSINVVGGRSGGENRARVGELDLGPIYFNRALVHVCLGDDGSALDDLDRAVARETRNIMYV